MKDHDPHPPRSWRRSLVRGTFLVLLALGIASPLLAETSSERAARGQVTYRIYCMNCHGQAAEGKGPLADLLKIPPTDLTRLALENDGEFSVDKVYEAIDGREEVRAHGSREMPVWGIGLQDRHRDADQEKEVRERILDLVAFIESLQKSESP